MGLKNCAKAGLYINIQIYGKGYQVSWCLRNREDQILLVYYTLNTL